MSLSNRQRRIAKKRTPSPPKVKAAGATITVLEPKRRKSGLDWLLAKGRITPRQARTGLRYGEDFRIVATNGVEPLRSCLDFEPSGGGGSGVAVSYAEVDMTSAERLHAARQRLNFHVDMTAALDAICGKGLTPREINPVQRQAEKIEQTLRLALDLIADNYPLTSELKRA